MWVAFERRAGTVFAIVKFVRGEVEHGDEELEGVEEGEDAADALMLSQ